MELEQQRRKIHFGALDATGLGRAMCKVRLYNNGPYHFTGNASDVTCRNCLAAMQKHLHKKPELMKFLARLKARLANSNDFDAANMIGYVMSHIERLEVAAQVKEVGKQAVKQIEMDLKLEADNKLPDDKVGNALREIFRVHLGVFVDKIKMDAEFVGDLGADSLDTLELIMQIEEEFEMEIPDEHAERFERVGDVYRYITNRINTGESK